MPAPTKSISASLGSTSCSCPARWEIKVSTERPPAAAKANAAVTVWASPPADDDLTSFSVRAGGQARDVLRDGAGKMEGLTPPPPPTDDVGPPSLAATQMAGVLALVTMAKHHIEGAAADVVQAIERASKTSPGYAILCPRSKLKRWVSPATRLAKKVPSLLLVCGVLRTASALTTCFAPCPVQRRRPRTP